MNVKVRKCSLAIHRSMFAFHQINYCKVWVVLFSFMAVNCNYRYFSEQNITTSCLNSTNVNSMRYLVYPDNTESPVLLPYMSVISSQMISEVSYILLTEVIGYHAKQFDPNSIFSADFISFAAGCLDPSDQSCSKRDFDHPLVHFCFETWTNGVIRAEILPENIRPTLLDLQEYNLDESFYLWPQTHQAALESSDHLWLDDYHFYNSNYYQPHKYFEPWQRMIEVVPLEMRARCTDVFKYGLQQSTFSEVYFEVSNDTARCEYNDSVWLTQACRRNTSRCTPLLITYNLDFAMQISYFLNMSLAIIMVNAQADPDSSFFYSITSAYNFLFQWYTPDDSPAGPPGPLPVMIQFPAQNLAEQLAGLYRTGKGNVAPRTFAWAQLASVDAFVSFFASRLSFEEADMQLAMTRSRALRAGGLVEPFIARHLACLWVKENEDRWRTWIPADCPPGAYVAESMLSCAPCPPGSVCPGGREPPRAAPPGYFSGANATAAIACPVGRTTPGEGSSGEANCTTCAGGYWPIAAACVAWPVLVASIAAPLCAAAALAALLLSWRQAAREEAAWKILAEEIQLLQPLEVLGRGSQGVVCRAVMRGTEVAIKRLSHGPPQRPVLAGADSSPKGEEGEVGGVLASSLGSLWQGRRSRGRLRRDILALVGIRHPRVVTMLGVTELDVEGERGVCLVMELMELGSLWDLLHNRAFPLHADTALGFLEGVAQGMRFLHGALPPVLHCDLKSANVLVDAGFGCKIADITPPSRRRGGCAAVGTGLWLAPECLSGASGNTAASDVYAYGVVVYEVLTRRAPFDEPPAAMVCAGRLARAASAPRRGFVFAEHSEQVEALVAAGKLRLELPAGCSAEMVALLADCCALDPALRISFVEVTRRLAKLEPGRLASPALLDESAPPPTPGARRGKDSQWRAAAARRKSTEDLMLSMFPRHVVEALVRGETVPPEYKDNVTMFFSDIVSFTTLSGNLSPEKVVVRFRLQKFR